MIFEMILFFLFQLSKHNFLIFFWGANKSHALPTLPVCLHRGGALLVRASDADFWIATVVELNEWRPVAHMGRSSNIWLLYTKQNQSKHGYLIVSNQ